MSHDSQVSKSEALCRHSLSQEDGEVSFPFLNQDGAFQKVGTGHWYLAEAWEDIALDSSRASLGWKHWGGQVCCVSHLLHEIKPMWNNQMTQEMDTTLGTERKP